MQPRLLAIIITILPLITTHAVYLLSAYEGNVPWCNPYFDGCTTISQAARSGSSLYVYRAVMIAYAVLLIWFWVYTRQWLTLILSEITKLSRVIMWSGIIGALSLMVYIDFLGTTGEINRFMRRYGIMIFFTFTPLAQVLLLKLHYKALPAATAANLKRPVLQFQLSVLLIMSVIGIVSIILDVAELKTSQSENIVEWTFALLMNIYFAGMIFIWRDYRYQLSE
jgi:hypothetical protein